MKKSLYELYSSEPSSKGLEGFKKCLLKTDDMKLVYKSSEKSENWVGYENSSSSERHDTESEEETDHNAYIDKLSKGITIDSNTRKVKSKQFTASDDITWLGVKPNTIEFNSPEIQGNDKTTYRDEHGVIVEKAEVKPSEANKERLKLWAGGEAQRIAKEELRDLVESEKKKPFARYEIDESYDLELKKRQRFGDPLSDIVEAPKKKHKFMWENRFGIVPGKNWDGVDRSNGFEQKWLAKQGKKVWENSVAYKNFASEL